MFSVMVSLARTCLNLLVISVSDFRFNLVTHIIIALSSVAYSTLLFFRPSITKVKITYGMMAFTIATGTYLVVTGPHHILSTCISGLVYVGAVSIGVIYAHQKLAREKIRIDEQKQAFIASGIILLSYEPRFLILFRRHFWMLVMATNYIFTIGAILRLKLL